MNRRSLIASSLFGIAASARGQSQALPPSSLLASNADKYWGQIRKDQFFLPEWRAFLNNGSLGVAPRKVVDAIFEFEKAGDGRIGDEYPRWGYETLDAERTELASFLGCKKDELAITHCATESMSMIAAGLDLKAGDEVLITNEEHPSGKAPWHRRAQRDGITVREVTIPHPPRSSAQLADLLISAIGPRTRVLSFSGIITGTGVIMPVRQICDAARAKGVITVVDGAHVNGQIPFRLDESGCDYFAGSPHKWMFAPAGCGILYIREENLDRLWPTIVTGGWDDKSAKAARFMKVGTNNRAITTGLIAGLRFLKELGPENVYARIHQLAKRTYKLIAERPYLELVSPADDSMYGCLVTMNFRGAKLDQLWRQARERKIWVYGSARLRLSHHIHTRPEDIDAFFALTDELLGRKG
jgi:selenocysteine lyase/cysteine desulfurase